MARAADQIWDPNGNAGATGGSGNWIDGGATWSPGPWSNAALDTAIFGGTGAGPFAVTVDATGISAGGLTFNSAAYTIAGPGTLTLGTGSTITMNAAATISASLSAADFSVTGTGLLTLTGANTITTGLTLTSGNLAIGNSAALGAGTLIIAGTGSSVQASGGAQSVSNAVLANADFTVAGANNLTFTGTTTLSAARAITLNNTGLTTFGAISGTNTNLAFNGGGAVTVTGIVGTGSGTLAISGGSTVTLSNTGNTFTGNITVDGAGSVLAYPGSNGGAGDPLALGSGTKSITLTSGAAVSPSSTSNPTSGTTKSFVIGTGGGIFNVATGVTFTLDDATQFSGTGDLTVTGAGTGLVRILTQAYNGFTGNVNVNSGTLQINNTNSLGNTAGRTVTVASGAAFDMQAANVPQNIVLNGTGVTSGGALINSSVNAASTASPISLAGNSSVGGNGTGGITLSGVLSEVTPGTTLGKVGTGALTLSGAAANTFTGLTTVSAGTLALNKTAGVNAIGGNLTVAGGTVSLSASNQIPDTAALAVSSGTFDFNAKSETLASMTLTGGITQTTAGAGAVVAVTGAGSVTGASTQFIINSGTQVSFNSLTLTGGTGTNFLQGGSNATSETLLTVGSGGLSLNGTLYTINPGTTGTQGGRLLLNGDVTVGGTAASSLLVGTANPVNPKVDLGTGPTRTFNVADATSSSAADLTVAIAVVGSSGLTKTGAGTMVLSNANTYTGTTNVSGGILRLSNATALPGGIGATGGTNNLSLGGGGVVELAAGDFTRGLGTGAPEVQFTGSGGFGAVGAARNVNFGGALAPVVWNTASFVPTGSALILGSSSSDNTVTFQNPLDLNTATSRTIQADNGSAAIDGTISGVISATGGGGFTKTGLGTLSLSATNTYTGTTTVNAGTLSVATSANLGATPGAVVPNSIILDGGTLGTTATFTLDTNRGILVGSSPGSGTGTIDVANTTTLTYGGVIADNGAGADNFVKTGGGTLILTAPQAYTGTTSVSAGVLQFAPNALANSTVLLSGGTLSLLADGNGLASGIVLPVTPGLSKPDPEIAATFDDPLSLTASSFITVGKNTAAQALNKVIVESGGLTTNGAFALTVNNNNQYGLNLSGITNLTTAAPTFSVATAATSQFVPGLILSGQVTGGFGFTKAGVGTMVLTNNLVGAGSNDFAGNMTVTGGVLGATSDAALGAGTNNIILNGTGATFQAFDNVTTSRTFTFSQASAANNVIGVVGARTLTINSPFTGANGYTKIDNGTLILSANNSTYTGQLIVAGGLVRLTNSNALGTAGATVPAILNQPGAALQLDGTLGALTITRPIALGGTGGRQTGVNSGGALENFAGNNTVSGAITLNFDAGIGARAGTVLNVTGGIVTNGHFMDIYGDGDINVNTTGLTGTFYALNKFGSGTTNWGITATTTNNGPTISGGTFAIAGTGVTYTPFTGWTINGGATLKADDTGTPVPNRLGNGKTLSLATAKLEYQVSATGGSSESIGALTSAWGGNTIQVNTTGQSSLLTFASLAGNIVSGGSTLTFKAGAAGAGLAFGTAANTVLFTTAPTLAAPTIGIIPRAIVLDASGINFATYNNTGLAANTNGIQALASYNIPVMNSVIAGGTVVTVASTAGLANGQVAYGPGVPAGTTITITSPTTLTLSNASTNATVLLAYGAPAYTDINSTTAQFGTGDNVKFGTGFVTNGSNISSSRTFNSFNLFGPGTTVNSGAGAGSATFTLTSGNILSQGAGTNTIGSGAIINFPAASAANSGALNVATGNTLAINGVLTGIFDVTKGLDGDVTFGTRQYFNTAAQYFTINGGGTVSLAAGVTNTLFPGVQGGTVGSYLSVGKGATLNLNGGVQLVGGLNSPNNTAIPGSGGTITSVAAATLVNAGGAALGWAGQITDNVFYAKAGAQTQTIYSDNTYTGGTLINGGLVVLRDSGRLSGTGNITINYAQLMAYNDGLSGDFDRINDTSAITLNGGRLGFKGRQATTSTEKVGDVTLASGTSVISAAEGSNAVLLMDGILTLNSLTRTASAGATVGFTQIYDVPTGTAASGLGIMGSGEKIFVNGLTNVAGTNIIGGWAAATGGFFATTFVEFASYNPGLGVGPLNQTGYAGYDGTALVANQPTKNYRITSGAGVVPTGGSTVNSLNLASNQTAAVTLTFGGTNDILNVTSGGLMIQNVIGSSGATSVGTVGGNLGKITAGGSTPGTASDLYLYFYGNGSALTINSQITDNLNGTGTNASGVDSAVRLVLWGANGFSSQQTVNGSTTLTNPANNWSGGTVVNQTGLTIGATGALPAGGITLNGSTLTQTAGGTIAPQLATLNGSSTLTLAAAINNSLTGLVFNNNGGVTNPSVVSGGVLTLSGATPISVTTTNNPATIATVSGTLDFGNAAKSIFVDPTRVNGPLSPSVAPLTPGLNISALIQNSGLITKTGDGVLQLSSTTSTFTGGVNLSAGALVIGASSNLAARTFPEFQVAVTAGPLGTGTLAIAGGTRILSSASANIVGNLVTIGGNFEFDGLNNVTFNGDTTLGAATRTISVNAPQMTATLGGVISGAAGVGIVKNGYGTLILANGNTFSGDVTLNSGTLVGSLPFSAGVSASPLGSGAVAYNGGSLSVRSATDGDFRNNINVNAALTAVNLDVQGTAGPNTIRMGNLDLLPSPAGSWVNLTGGSAANPSTLVLTTNSLDNNATPASVARVAGEYVSVNVAANTTLAITSGGFARNNEPLNIGLGTLLLGGTNFFANNTTVTTSNTGAAPLANAINAVYGNTNQTVTLSGTGLLYTVAPQVGTIAVGAIPGATSGGLQQTFTNISASTLPVAANWGLGPGSVFNGVQPNDAAADRVAYTNPNSGLVTYNGYLNITAGGTYSFIIGSDDFSALVIDGVEVGRDTTTGHGVQDTARGSILLSAGQHAITMKINVGTGQPGGGSRLLYSGPDTAANSGNNGYQAIPSAALSYFTGPASAANNFYNAAQIDNDYALAASTTATLQGLGADFNSTLKSLTLGNSSTLSATNDLAAIGIGGTGFIGVKGVTTLGTGVTLNPTTANLYLIGGIDDGAANGLIKTGAGTLSLNKSGTTGDFNGAFAINAGTVRIFEADALSTGGNTVASGASLDLNGSASSTGRNVTINAAGTASQFGALYNSSPVAGSLAGTLALATASTIAGYGDIAVSGAVTSSTLLTKAGPDTLTLSGSNATMTGGLTIAAGVVNNGSATGLGGGAGIVTVNAGTALNLNGFGTDRAITLNGTSITNQGPNQTTLGNLINSSLSTSFSVPSPAAAGSAQLKQANAAATATVSGNITLSTATSGIGSNTFGAGGDIIISGIVAGTQQLTKVGGNTVFLRGVNTFATGPTVNWGALTLDGAGVFNGAGGSISVNEGSTFTLDNGTTFTNNRVNNNVAANNRRLLLLGGTLTITGNASTANDVTELFSASVATSNPGIRFDQGHNNINLTPVVTGGAITVTATRNTTSLDMEGGNAATALITARRLGLDAAGTDGSAYLGLTNSASTSGLHIVGQNSNTAGGGNNGLANKGISPFIIVDDGVGDANFAVVGSTTVGAVAANASVRELGAATGEYAAAQTNLLTANNNTLITANTTTATSFNNANISLNSLKLTGGTLTLVQGSSMNLQSGGILATADATIAGPGIISVSGTPVASSTVGSQNLYIHTIGVGTNLTLSANIGFSGQNSGQLGEVVKAGTGNVILSGTNFYTTNTRVQEGTLTLGNDLAIFYRQTAPASINNFNSSNNGPTLQVNQGGTVDLKGFDLNVNNFNSINPAAAQGSLSGGTIVNSVAGTKNFVINNTGNNTWSGNISSGTGAVAFSRYGQQTFTITNENSYTGATVLGGGATTLVDVGALRGGGAVTINSAALIWNDNGTQGDAYRLGATPAAVTLNGGGFQFNGRAGAFSVANLGAVTLASGASQFSSTAGSNGNATIQMATFARNAGAVVNFAGSTLGDDGNIKVTGGVTNFNGIVGGWAISNTTNPYSVLQGGDFVEYDPATGFRSIVDYKSTAILDYASGIDRPAFGTAAFGAGNNIRVNTNGTVTLPAGVNVANSMVIGSGGTTTLAFTAPADTLFIQSGGILGDTNAQQKLLGATVAGGGKITAGNTDGTAGPGNPTYDLYLHNLANTMTVNAQIVDNPVNPGAPHAVNLITSTGSVSGPVIRLANTNTYTGATTVNSTDLQLISTVGAAIANSTSLSIVGGNTNAADSSTQTMSRIQFQNAGSQLNSGATVSIINNATLDTNNFNQTLAGLVFNNTGGHTSGSSGIGGSVRTGLGTLTLTGNITATNLTNTSTIPFIAGNLDLNGGQRTITVDAITGAGVQGAAQIGLSIFADMVNGGLDKEGAGVLAITGLNTYTGTTNVNAGTLVLAGRDQASPGVALTANIARSRVDADAGTTVDMRGGNAIVGSLNGAGTVTNSVYATTSAATGMPGTLIIGADNTSTGNFSGRFTNFINNINENTGYALNVTKFGTGTQTISGDNAVPLSPANSNGDINNVGTLDIQEGTILVNGANGSLGFFSINLRAGGTLTLDNSIVNKTSRLGGFHLTDSANGDTANDTTATRAISMQGGTLTFKEGATLVNEGDFNALSMATNPGVGTVTLLIGNSTWNFDTAGGSAGATVEANAFTAGNGSLLLNANPTSGSTQTLGRAVAGANSVNVYVAGGMTGQGSGALSAPNTALGTTNAGVQGNIVGGIRPDMIGTDFTGTGFVTYDRFGYRLLQDTEYSAFPAQPQRPQETGSAATPTNPPPSWAAVSPTITATYTGNARVNTSQTWTTNTSVFDLRLDSGGKLTSAGGSVPLVNSPAQLFNALGTLNTLTVSTGSIIGNTGNTGLIGGALSAGANPFRIYTLGDLASSAYLVSTNNVTGLIKEGAGILNLTKPAFFGIATDPGQTVVNAGTLWLNSGANTLTVLNTAAGSVANSIDTLTINQGATVDLKGFDQVVGNLNSADVSPGGGGTLTNSGALANFYTNANATFGGGITGAINLYKTGSSNLTLTSPSTYTGATIVQGGILVLQDSATLASPTYNLNGGQLRSSNIATSLSGIANRAPSSATWNMRSGTYLELGRPGENTFDTVATVNALEGFNVFQVDATTGAAAALNIDTINLTAGAQVHFNTGFGTLGQVGANPTIYFDTAPTTIGGILPWAVASTDQPAMYITTINPLTGGHYGIAVPNVNGTANYQATQITAATTGQNLNQGTGTITEANTVATRQFNSFRFSSNTATTVALNAGGGVGSAAPGGEIVRLEAGALITNGGSGSLSISNGQITAGVNTNTAATLYSTQIGNTTTLNTQIADNGTGALTFVKGGSGTLALNPQPSAGIAFAATATGTLAGSTTLTLSATPTATLVAGDRIVGPGIPNGTTIVSIAGAVITMSQPALASVASGTYGFGNAQSLPATSVATGVVNPVIPMANTAGLYIGQPVSGTGITGTISAISPNTNITVIGTTSAATGTTLSFNSAAIIANEAFSGSLIVNTGPLSFTAAAGNGRRLTNSSSTVPNPALVINNGGTVTLTPGGALAPTTDVTINGGGALTFGVSANAVTGINALNSLTFNNNGGTVVPTVNIVAAGILTLKNGLVTSNSDNQGTTPLLTNGTLNFGQISLGTSTTGSSDVTVADVAGFVAGQTVTGAGITAGSTISSISGNTLTLSLPVGTGATGVISTVNQVAGSTTAMIPTINVTTLTPGKVTADLQIVSVIANSQGWTNLAGGGAALRKTGNGVLTLSAANTFDNGFNLNEGTVIVGNAAAFGTGPLSLANGTTILGDSALTLAAGRTITNAVNVNGDFTFGGQQSGATNGHNLALNGTMNLGGATRNITVTSPLVTAAIGGVISNGGLTKSGDGILTLSGANTYAGGTILNGGLLIAGNASALGANTNDLTVKSNATLNLSGQSLTVDGLNGDNATLGGLITNSGATATLTIGNNNEATATFAGTITNTGVNATTNALGLTKVGTGTQIFNGTNSYTGPTNVTAGTLVVNGLQASATGLVTVSLGATLGGSGTINGPTTIQNGGNLKPGNSAGLLTFNSNLTLGGDTTNSTFEIQGTARGTAGGYDAINLGSTSLLTYDGVLTLDISTALSNGTFDLFAFTAAPTGSFDQVTLLGSGGYSGNLTNSAGVWSGDSQGQTFTFTQATGDLLIVPEPGALVSLLGGLGVLLGFRRARRRG
jgi:autotransporter-associated beta strand protein